MQLTYEQEGFQASGITPTKFKMELNPIAFRVLSDGLYKDKIGAVVRELSCNAYDAALDSKATTMFDIHSPTFLDPFFHIRDYGTGLNEEDIENVYYNYFASTKRNDNDKIGCFGLGSKSPFAYTNSFTVTSYHDNMKKDYCIFQDAEGYPSVSKIYEEPTNEPNGLKVTVEVSSKDFDKFESAIQKFCFPFKNIKSNVEIEDPIVVMQHELFKIIIEPSYFTTVDRFLISYGNILYPVNLSLSDMNTPIKIDSGYAMVIDVPLGELDITPSREELGYTPKTIQYIKNVFDSIHSYIQSNVRDILQVAQEEAKSTFRQALIINKKIEELYPTNFIRFPLMTVEGKTVNVLTNARCSQKHWVFTRQFGRHRRKTKYSVDAEVDIHIVNANNIKRANLDTFFDLHPNQHVVLLKFGSKPELEEASISLEEFVKLYPATPKVKPPKDTKPKQLLPEDHMEVLMVGGNRRVYTVAELSKMYYVKFREFTKDQLSEVSSLTYTINKMNSSSENVMILNQTQLKKLENIGVRHFRTLISDNYSKLVDMVKRVEFKEVLCYYANTSSIIYWFTINKIFKLPVDVTKAVYSSGICKISSLNFAIEKLFRDFQFHIDTDFSYEINDLKQYLTDLEKMLSSNFPLVLCNMRDNRDEIKDELKFYIRSKLKKFKLNLSKNALKLEYK